MLPNHAPLMVAEAFGTLASLYPGRIDLGVGRAPGTDQLTARALRRTLNGDIDAYPQDVLELMGYFEAAQPGQAVQAVPGAGLDVPVWILGSSTYGAQLAAALGLPYAFASHFAPADMQAALAIYRSRFKPSAHLRPPSLRHAGADRRRRRDRRRGPAAVHLDAAELRSTCRTGQSRIVCAAAAGGRHPRAVIDPALHPLLDQVRARAVVGSLETVRQGLSDFQARTDADEIMVFSPLFDQSDRIRSLEIIAEAHGSLRAAALT